MDQSEPGSVVRVEVADEHVAMITIDRETAGNAVNADVARGLDAAIKQTEADPAIWVTILTGAGTRSFCAGADLREVAAGRAEMLLTRDGGFGGFVHAARTKPCIAAVEGVAVAGGLEIMLACDLVVAAETARFGLPEVKRGLIALAGGLYRLPRALPRALALEAILTGDNIDAQTACARGLINRVVPQGQARQEAVALARRICFNAPLAVRESLAIARASFDCDESQLKKREGDAWRRLVTTEDFKEGPRAFVEKRAPQWQGR
jgi:enoyl-CoA hydratase/carnithine racemase